MASPEQKCCPPPDGDDPFGPGNLTYVDSSGVFWNIPLDTYMTLTNWTDPDGTGSAIDVYGKCIRTQSTPVGYGYAYDPVNCPCCPDTYVWSHRYNTCFAGEFANGPLLSPSVPCITCICPTPTAQPICESCGESQGIHIAMTFDPTRKQCIECGVIGTPTPLPGFSQYMPIQLQDPIINFVLRT